MRIVIVNRFMPPDEAPTSVLAGELAEHLRQSGHDVECIASSSDYRSGKAKCGSLHRIAGELISHLILLFKMMTARKAEPFALSQFSHLFGSDRRVRSLYPASTFCPLGHGCLSGSRCPSR